MADLPNRVFHPARLDWGIGEVLDTRGTIVRVLFENAGPKQINLSYIQLKSADGPALTSDGYPLRVRENIDGRELRLLCGHFHEAMRDNRPKCDDGRMALHVVSDMQRFGNLQQGTARLLAFWCDEKTAPTPTGVPLAQKISFLLFGRILRMEELG